MPVAIQSPLAPLYSVAGYYSSHSPMAEISHVDHSVELIVCDTPPPPSPPINGLHGSGEASEEITPLLKQSDRPKINIFSVSYARRKPREQVIKSAEIEMSPVSQFILWVWGGSRYSGLLCVAISSAMYFLMETVSEISSGRPIPLFETAFTRCTMVAVLSYLWLRRSGQPIQGLANAWKLLSLRALMGCLSLFSFIYAIQRLPFSQASVLSFTTPIMASIVARIMLHERLKISDIGGLACSFFGVLFIFRHILTTQGREVLLTICLVVAGELVRSGESSYIVTRGWHHLIAVLVGLFSSITGGISYCLIKAGAKASDQPVATVLSFGILASPAAGICVFAFEGFVLPDFYSFLLMLTLGTLAFFIEVFLARGLQLEKTIKAANVLYIEAALSQLWLIGSLQTSPSFGGLVGCILVLISVSCTMYIGPDKESV